MKKVWKYLGILLSGFFPIASVMAFSGILDFNLYNWLWCGFYGCILVAFFTTSKLYKFLIFLLNLPPLLLCTYASLMGGFSGLGLALMSMLIPFYAYLVHFIPI